MSFYLSLFVWLILAAVLVVGVVMATKGSFVFLTIGMLAFFGAFVRYGCLGGH